MGAHRVEVVSLDLVVVAFVVVVVKLRTGGLAVG